MKWIDKDDGSSRRFFKDAAGFEVGVHSPNRRRLCFQSDDGVIELDKQLAKELAEELLTWSEQASESASQASKRLGWKPLSEEKKAANLMRNLDHIHNKK
jgi:hypothetical protein